jgi:hypothetical protein
LRIGGFVEDESYYEEGSNGVLKKMSDLMVEVIEESINNILDELSGEYSVKGSLTLFKEGKPYHQLTIQ